jgi:hypothetical protein
MYCQNATETEDGPGDFLTNVLETITGQQIKLLRK